MDLDTRDPSLCRLMPAVLQTLADRKDQRSSDIYLLSAVTALQRVIETLPHFISPYLQDVILQASEQPVTQTAPRGLISVTSGVQLQVTAPVA